jgi:hypothetical protein
MLTLRNTVKYFLVAIMLGYLLSSCSAKLQSKSVVRKYSNAQLQEDYDVLRNIMEKSHPSLYWYTSKDSMDIYFDQYRNLLADSMNEQQFGFRVLAPLTTKIRCGHTSFNFSKSWSELFRGMPLPSFPLYLKVWGDTMLVLSNLNRNDSVIKRGTQVTSVNGLNAKQLSDIMFNYMPTDGFAENVNYIRISNSFPYYHRNILGLSKQYTVGYLDSSLQEKFVQIPYFNPYGDTVRSKKKKDSATAARKKIPRTERLKFYRSLSIDTTRSLAILSVHSFDDGYGLNKFYKRSFRTIRKQKIEHLAIDIRNNGGGRVNNYVRLAKYIRNTPFKVADSAYSITRSFGPYRKYFQRSLINGAAMKFFTKKEDDGAYHFRYWERHTFKPRSKKLFRGDVYVLIGGPTFSASTLFCNTVQGQDNVTLIGEETGGGHHGNNGLMIPYVTLPNTKMRVSMPLFRLVQYNHVPKNGRGVIPDITISPVSTAIKQGIDLKMETVKSMIDMQEADTAKRKPASEPGQR